MLLHRRIMLKRGSAILIVILKIHCVLAKSITDSANNENTKHISDSVDIVYPADFSTVPNLSTSNLDFSNSQKIHNENKTQLSNANRLSSSGIDEKLLNSSSGFQDVRVELMNGSSSFTNSSNPQLVRSEQSDAINFNLFTTPTQNETHQNKSLLNPLNSTESLTVDKEAEKAAIENLGADIQKLKKNVAEFKDNLLKLLYEGETDGNHKKADNTVENTTTSTNLTSASASKNQTIIAGNLTESANSFSGKLEDNTEIYNKSNSMMPNKTGKAKVQLLGSVEDMLSERIQPIEFSRISAAASNMSAVTKRMGAFLQKQYWDSNPNTQKSEREEFIARGLETLVSGVEDGDDSEPYVLQQWVNLEESFRESVDAVVRQALPLLVRASSEMQLSNGCYTSFFKLLLGLRRLRPWAFQMIDAFGKPPAGMLQGTVTSFGAYDECVNIVAKSDPKKKKTAGQQQFFRGKYCTVEIKPPLPPKPQYYTMYQPVSILANFSNGDDNVIRQAARQAHAFYFLTYRMDICVPSTCTQDDVNNMAQFAAKYIDIEVAVPRCSVKESLELDKSQVVIICVVGVLFAFVVFGTFLDSIREVFYKAAVVSKCISNVFSRLLLSFSLNTNAYLLLKTKSSKNGLDALHGMRFFGMGWLVLGHTYFNSNAQMYGNLSEASGFAEGFLFQVIVNSTVSIDTFFFISGVLLAYLTLQSTSKHGYYSIPRLFIRRLIRIMPPYMMVIGVTFLLPHLGSGPFWNETVDPVVESCRKNWWTNILFINNFITTPGQRCLEHSWYLSCDFQLFIIALFILLALIKRPLLGLVMNVGMIIISMVLTGMLTYYYKVPPTLLASFPDPEERKFLNHVIISKPYCHLGPYCVGLATGYFFYTCREIKLKAYHHILGWGSSITVTAAVVYGVLEWNKGNLPSTPAALAYAATHRTAWALGLSWITIICVAGYGGIISRILSWKVFIPLSRLTYMVYLIHPLIQYILTGYIRERLQTNHIILAYFFFGHIMTSYALAAACFFLFDGPVEALMRLLLGDCTAPAPQLAQTPRRPANNNAKTEKQRNV